MKLPEDKKERTQIFVLAGIVAAVLIFGLFQGISVYNTKKKEAREQIKKLHTDIDKASAKIQRMRKDRKENIQVLDKILELTGQYVIEPHLGGNYMLKIKGIINMHTREADITLPAPPRDKGARKLAGTDGTFHSYQAGLSLKCGYFDLLRLIYYIKEANPMVAITNIRIDPGKQDKAVHSITMDLQWPIWSNRETKDKLQEQLRNQTKERKSDGKQEENEADAS